MSRNPCAGKCGPKLIVTEIKSEKIEIINTIVEPLKIVLPIIKEIKKKKEIVLEK